MIALDGLAAVRTRLEQLEIGDIAHDGLAAAGQHIAASVRSALSTPPGGSHDTPWLRTGALRDSISVLEWDGAVTVASSSDVAVYQELGTTHLPPRPFLGPAAIGVIDDVAAMVAAAVHAAVQRDAEVA